MIINKAKIKFKMESGIILARDLFWAGVIALTSMTSAGT
jgi:hypothetical protein